MQRPFHVNVNKCNGRSLVLRWTDPETGQRHARSAGTTDRRKANRLAVRLEDELNAGTYQEPCRVTWQDFCLQYIQQELPRKKPRTQQAIMAAMNAVGRTLKPRMLTDLTTKRLSEFQRLLIKAKRSPETVNTYLSYLNVMLKWAVEMELLKQIPKLPQRPKRQQRSRAKGRPITGEEFDRLIEAVPKVVGVHAEASWSRLLHGLWLSGLRLGEALELRWRPPGGIVVDFSGRRPKLVIKAEAEKAGRSGDRYLPLAPDFVEFLERTPEHERRGRVFRPEHIKRPGTSYDLKSTSAIISAMGRLAGIKVHVYAHKDDKIKYASAHDLRRSFGTRWAPKVKPATLQVLMRHRNILTTLGYYVELDADDVADELWASHNGREIGNGASESAVFPRVTSQGTQERRV